MLQRKKTYKDKWKYKCYTAFREDGSVYFQVEDVKNPISWEEYLCNGNLYHDTLRECVGNRYSQTPVMYHGVNINVWQPDIFLKADRNGSIYRDYYFDDTNLRKFEKAVV